MLLVMPRSDNDGFCMMVVVVRSFDVHGERYFSTHKSPIYGHESPFYGHESPFFGHESLFFGHESLFFGHEL